MLRLNKCQFTGNVGANPETKTLSSGKKVSTFSLAINDGYYDSQSNWVERTYWIRCVAWQKTAEKVDEKVKKGDSVYIEGKLTMGEYEKDGVKKTSVDIVVHNIQLMNNNS